MDYCDRYSFLSLSGCQHMRPNCYQEDSSQKPGHSTSCYLEQLRFSYLDFISQNCLTSSFSRFRFSRDHLEDMGHHVLCNRSKKKYVLAFKITHYPEWCKKKGICPSRSVFLSFSKFRTLTYSQCLSMQI